MRNLANFALFQVVWFACVLGASDGNVWIGPLVTVVALALHFWTETERVREWKLLGIVAVSGVLVDSGVQALGAMTYTEPLAAISPIVPPWIISLWVAFGMLLRRSLSWMHHRIPLAVIFGLVGGPLSMRAGASLEAVELGGDLVTSYAWLGFEWGLLTPLYLLLARGNRELDVATDSPAP